MYLLEIPIINKPTYEGIQGIHKAHMVSGSVSNYLPPMTQEALFIKLTPSEKAVPIQTHLLDTIEKEFSIPSQPSAIVLTKENGKKHSILLFPLPSSSDKQKYLFFDPNGKPECLLNAHDNLRGVLSIGNYSETYKQVELVAIESLMNESLFQHEPRYPFIPLSIYSISDHKIQEKPSLETSATMFLIPNRDLPKKQFEKVGNALKAKITKSPVKNKEKCSLHRIYDQASQDEFNIPANDFPYPYYVVVVPHVVTTLTAYDKFKTGLLTDGAVSIGNTGAVDGPSKIEKTVFKARTHYPVEVVFDMETNDPDDVLALLTLLQNEKVRLKAVTIYPGSKQQVGLIKHICSQYGHPHMPIGAFDIDAKPSISGFHDKFGVFEPAQAPPGHVVLNQYCDANTVLITGGPLSNVAAAIDSYGDRFEVAELFAQGGFAGDNLIDDTHRLPKFVGKTTCQTHNFNADIDAAKKVLAHDKFGKICLVSKNVCHGISYTEEMHSAMQLAEHKPPALETFTRVMGAYLDSHETTKKLHDVLCVSTALNPEIATFVECTMTNDSTPNPQLWGATPALTKTGIFIIHDVNKSRFLDTLTT